MWMWFSRARVMTSIHGGDGDDLIDLDYFSGPAGNDLIYGNGGDDDIEAGGGNNTLYGGSGDDTLLAGSGNDILWGEDGNDSLRGEDGADYLSGGGGDDYLSFIGDGPCEAYGGEGQDFFHVAWFRRCDTPDRWRARIDLIETGLGGVTDLTAQTYVRGDYTQTFTSIEGAMGRGEDDVIIGSFDVNWLIGSGGNDLFVGGGGDDVIIGGGMGGRPFYEGFYLIEYYDFDTVSYTSTAGAVNVVLQDETSYGHATSVDGYDRLYLIENAIGGVYNDTLSGNYTNNILEGGLGSDLLSGLNAADSLFGEQGDDFLVGGGDDDAIYGGDGVDYAR